MQAEESFLRAMRASRSNLDEMHPDEAAFLAAIEAQPDDDLPRLVFADWLDERGDPRGPWVRDPDIWPFMAPDAADPVLRLLEPRVGAVFGRNQDLLARLGPAAAPALAGALWDEYPCVRIAAARALGLIGPEARGVAPDLVGALGWYDPKEHEAVIEALGRIGADAVPPLLERIASTRAHETYLPALKALRQIGSAAVPPCVVALQDQDRYVRRAAAEALGWLGELAYEAIPALLVAFWDESDSVRATAALSLAGIGRRESIPGLIVALGDESCVVRPAVVVALGKFGQSAEIAVPALVATLRDEDSEVCHLSAEALGQIGPAAAEAVSALVFLRDDPLTSDTMRDRVSEALVRITAAE